MSENFFKNGVSHETAKRIITNCASFETIFLRGEPGVGKSELILQAARLAGLKVKHLYGSQMTTEDTGGLPQIRDGKVIHFPLEDYIPEDGVPFCLLIDEYPVCSPDVQKALYSIILDRKVGDYSLPKGTWVVLAGNNKEDHALVRNISSALTNRVLTLDLKLDVNEWLEWAKSNSINKDVLGFITKYPDLLLDKPPVKPAPFSTPRSWTMLANAMDLLKKNHKYDIDLVAPLAFGALTKSTAEKFLQFVFKTKKYPEAISLSKAGTLVRILGRDLSLLLLSSPGVGKTDIVRQMAEEEKLPYVSLLGTQIMPEDVYGMPRIVGDRVHFFPMKMFAPDDEKPICLFLDELPACSPDVQKAFYSLLLDHCAGTHHLPEGSIVVAAGNRMEDQALVRGMSSALVNRTIMLQVRPNLEEWLLWAKKNNIRKEIRSYIKFTRGEALERPIVEAERPFSSPRSWAKLSKRLDLQGDDLENEDILHAIVKGCISPEDTEIVMLFVKHSFTDMETIEYYVKHPEDIPMGDTPVDLAKRYLILESVRCADNTLDNKAKLVDFLKLFSSKELVNFLKAFSKEDRNALLTGRVDCWKGAGVEDYLVQILNEMTGLDKYRKQKKNGK